MAARIKVHAVIKKGPGTEIHIRTMKVDGIDLTDIRDFYPSLKNYGRGIAFPSSLLKEMVNGLVLARSIVE